MAGLAERWEQSAIKAEELGLLEILVGDSNKTDIDFATVALLRRARVWPTTGIIQRRPNRCYRLTGSIQPKS
jgi:hypothetical protein